MTQLINNAVKRAAKAGRSTPGPWLSLCSPIAAEIMAGAGFDWLVIARHSGAAALATAFRAEVARPAG